MKVTVNDAPKSQKELKVELPYEDFVKTCDTECDKIAKKAKIPGFRPGKAPKDVVMKQYKHQIRANALEELINDRVSKAIIENKVNAISRPDVKNVVLDDGKPITFNIFVDVYPDIELNNYKNFDFDRTVIKVDDKDVDDTITRVRENMASFQPLSENRPVKNLDQVVIDFEGKVDGIPFEGGKAEKYPLEIGSGQFIPGFEEQLLGLEVGASKDIDVKFPDDYHQTDLAGKDSVFSIKLHEIKEKKQPELNDEFASKVNKKATDIDSLKEVVKKDLQYESDQYVKYSTFTDILNKLVEENPFEVPASIVDEQASRMAQQSLQQYYQMGLNPEMYGITVDSIKGQYTQEAEKQVKRALMVSRVAEQEKLEVSDEDIDNEIDKLSDISGRDKDDIKKEVMGQHFANFKNDILADKVYDFLCGVNQIKDRVVSREEFEKEAKAKAEEERKQAENKKQDSVTGEDGVSKED